MLVVRLTLIAILSLSLGHESAQATPPNQVCAAIVGGFLRYRQFLKSEAETATVVQDLHSFAWGFDESSSGPAAKKLSLNRSQASSSEIKKMLAQIEGIEKNWREPSRGQIGMDEIIAGIKLEGEEAILKFYSDLQQTIQEVSSTAGMQSAPEKKWRTSISAFSLLASVVLWGGYLTTKSDLLGWLATNATLAPIVMDSPGLIAYAVRQDSGSARAARQLEQLVEGRTPGDWAYDSWSYTPEQKLITALVQNGVEKSEVQIQEQDLHDTRTAIWRTLNSVASQRKRDPKTWVGLDRLVRVDESGKPTLWLVLRTRSERPIFPKKVTETEKEYQGQTSLVPVFVPVPVKK